MKRKWMAMVLLLMGLNTVSEAYRPAGWVYGLDLSDHYIYENTTGKWFFVNPSATKCVCNMNTREWWAFHNSLLRSGWSYWQWPYAYRASSGVWYFIAGEATPWVYDMTGRVWTRLGAIATSTQESQVHTRVNAYRVSYGRSALTYHTGIAAVARAHSQNGATGAISQSQFIAHAGVDSRFAQVRTFMSASSLAENVAYNQGYSDPAWKVVDQWKNSPGHNANMLNSIWTHTGVGAAQSSNGTWYYTQIFVKNP